MIKSIAAEEFNRRRERARRAVAEGMMHPDEANDHAHLWLAIAAAAGADLPELQETWACVWPEGADFERRTPSCDIAPRDKWLPELARARDVALAKFGQVAGQGRPLDSDGLALHRRAAGMQRLALHLGAPHRGQTDATEALRAAA